jgi:hypothetical protein
VCRGSTPQLAKLAIDEFDEAKASPPNSFINRVMHSRSDPASETASGSRMSVADIHKEPAKGSLGIISRGHLPIIRPDLAGASQAQT